MREQGLSDRGLAARTRYNQSTISRYLQRKRGRVLTEETAETMSETARALGKEPDYLLEVRIYQARAELEQAMREGIVNLQDVRGLVQKARARHPAEQHHESG